MFYFRGGLTCYGTRVEVREQLAGIRSFVWCEFWALTLVIKLAGKDLYVLRHLTNLMSPNFLDLFILLYMSECMYVSVGSLGKGMTDGRTTMWVLELNHGGSAVARGL